MFSSIPPRSVAEIWTFDILKIWLLGFDPIGNSAVVQSADLENPTLEPNVKWTGCLVAEIQLLEMLQSERSVAGPQHKYLH